MQFRKYLVSYRYDGSEWNVEVPATSFDDARQRLAQLHFGRVEGELVANVPGAFGPFALLIAWVRNTFTSASR